MSPNELEEQIQPAAWLQLNVQFSFFEREFLAFHTSDFKIFKSSSIMSPGILVFPIFSVRIPHPIMMCPCMALGATPYLGHDTHRLTDLARMVWFPNSDHRLHGTYDLNSEMFS